LAFAEVNFKGKISGLLLAPDVQTLGPDNIYAFLSSTLNIKSQLEFPLQKTLLDEILSDSDSLFFLFVFSLLDVFDSSLP
jgi:hypothetical protein